MLAVEADTLLGALRRISGSLERERVIEGAITSLVELAEAERGALVLGSGQPARLVVLGGASRGPGGEVEPRSLAELHQGRWLRDDLVHEVAEHKLTFTREGEGRKVASLACLAAERSDHSLVIAQLEHSERAGLFDRERIAVLELLLGQTAIALDHADAHAASQARVRELQEREAHLRAVLDNTSAVVFLKDLEGRYVLVNTQLERATGLSREQILGKDDYQLFPRATAERLRADDRHAVETGEAAEYEGVTEFPDGPRVFVTTKFPVRDESGRIYGVCGVSTDITARKRAEEVLAARERDLQITFDSIGDAMIASNAEGEVTRMNPAAERLTGWEASEAIGRPFTEVAPFFDLGSDARADESARLANAGGHLRLRDRRGDTRLVAKSEAPIRDADGREVGRVAVIRDVSERLRLEEQLRHSQKMDAIGRLGAGIAHDFNNMLAAILNAAELLDMRLPAAREPGVAESLEVLVGASERAADLTGKLLAFSRAGSRRRETLDLHQVIEATVRPLRRSLDRRVEIELSLDAPRPTVVGDPTLIQSALLNLGLNARDAMPRGGRLELATRVVELSAAECAASRFELQPGPHVELCVRDTGEGVEEELRLRIFEPFFTTKGVGEGSGLGLAAVHGTVVDLGGAIRVDSQPGAGACFVITLPLVAEAPSSSPPEPARAPRECGDEGQGLILLVDDEQVVRKSGAALLESLGYEVLTACDGREAVELFAERHATIDLVLLDMVMPHLDGREAYVAMREIDSAVPIVLCSGYSANEAVQGLDVGFLAKPYRRATLAEVVAGQLRARRVHPPAP